VNHAPRILAFSGSSRRDSFNRKLLTQAAAIAREAGAEVTEIDLIDYPLPIYDGDWEDAHGLPEHARKLKGLMKEHDGFLIASPEYNGSLSPLLKNVIDWCSRAENDKEPTLQAYDGKTAALLAASPGGLGGIRGLRHVREILGNIGVYVVPAQFALSSAHQAFDESGNLTDPRAQTSIRRVVNQLISLRVNG
jgi:chromate reductase, NAD(P)H dehydrogenase (quinone)